jgi:ribonuclease R
VRAQAGTQAGEVERLVRDALEAARRLGVERDARETLEDLFEQAELAPTMANGEVTLALAEPHANAYRLIERLMVAANEAVGGWLVRQGMPALYRAHEGIAPEQRHRLHAAAELVGASVPSLDADPDRVAGELLSEIERLGVEGRGADRDLLISAVTSSTARATYDPDPASHRGLATSAYCHFSSPLRRYADLVVHRQVRAALAGEAPPHDVAELDALSTWLEARAGALARLEARERSELWARLLELGELAGRETATVTGLSGAGLRIRLPRLGLSGFVAAEDALGAGEGERATLSTDEHGLTTTSGPWRVGSRVEVCYAGLDEVGRASWRLRSG